VRFGISDRSELRIVVPNYLESLTGLASASGFGDVAVGMKQQLGRLPGEFDLSVIIALSIPTGADRISSHGYDPFIKFPWSKTICRRSGGRCRSCSAEALPCRKGSATASKRCCAKALKTWCSFPGENPLKWNESSFSMRMRLMRSPVTEAALESM
jgi:hypothetical protein